MNEFLWFAGGMFVGSLVTAGVAWRVISLALPLPPTANTISEATRAEWMRERRHD